MKKAQRSNTIVTQRTQDLMKAREEESIANDYEKTQMKVSDQLQQFSEIKRILINYTFTDDERRILVAEIVAGILDEMRMERKIMLIIDDEDVDAYVEVDIGGVDLYDTESHKDFDEEKREIIARKAKFREEFSARAAATRLDYMIRIMTIIFGKATRINDPERYSDKVKKIERAERKIDKELERQGSSQSLFSLYSKS